jgi:hypothetical protein
MSFSENLQYNVALPGAEFRARDLSVPAVAAKTVYEIDFGWGQNKPFCLSILFEAFRGVDRVTQILNESSQLFQKGTPRKADWQIEIVKYRATRSLIIERKMDSLKGNIKNFEARLGDLMVKEEALRAEVEMEDVEVSEVTPPGEVKEGAEGRGLETPKPLKKGLFQARKKFADLRAQITTVKANTDAAEAEFDKLAAESGELKSDPLNQTFSAEEEQWGKERVLEKGVVMDGGGTGEKSSRKF